MRASYFRSGYAHKNHYHAPGKLIENGRRYSVTPAVPESSMMQWQQTATRITM